MSARRSADVLKTKEPWLAMPHERTIGLELPYEDVPGHPLLASSVEGAAVRSADAFVVAS